jgi:hypothetical protein
MPNVLGMRPDLFVEHVKEKLKKNVWDWRATLPMWLRKCLPRPIIHPLRTFLILATLILTWGLAAPAGHPPVLQDDLV